MTTEKKKSSPLKDLIGGFFGGIGQCLVGHPFDTIKVRLQTQPTGDRKLYNGFIDCFKKTLQMEGIGGLYKGVGAPLTGTAALVGVKFFSFGKSKELVSQMNENPNKLELWQFFLSGSLAGFMTAFVESPVDFFKSQMQVQIFRQQQAEKELKLNLSHSISSGVIQQEKEILYRNVFHCGKIIVQKYGLRGAYQGLGATILRNIQGNCWFFGFSEVTRRAFLSPGKTAEDLHVSVQFLAGGIGGIFYWLLSFPFDVMKSSLQGDSPEKKFKRYSGYLDCASKLYSEGGIQRFYKGFTPCMIRSFPANSAAFGLWFVVSKKILS